MQREVINNRYTHNQEAGAEAFIKIIFMYKLLRFLFLKKNIHFIFVESALINLEATPLNISECLQECRSVY